MLDNVTSEGAGRDIIENERDALYSRQDALRDNLITGLAMYVECGFPFRDSLRQTGLETGTYSRG